MFSNFVSSIFLDFLSTTNNFDEPRGLDGLEEIKSLGKSNTKDDKSI